EAGEERVSVSDILYLEAQNQNILICTAERSYVVRYNLRDYERELRESGFFRIHRGYLVSLGKIIAVRKNEVTLEGGISLPLSRTRERSLKEALYQFIKREAL
nr:LytTR family transcriptional regulator DNA-binding domain-containing protein [Lachnospiraceae bacterium]